MTIYKIPIKNYPIPWFDLIKNKIKTYEGRLNRGIFVKMKPGDFIIFVNRDKEIKTQIIDIKKYKSFGKAFDDLQFNLVPIDDITRKEVKKLYSNYFTKDDIKQYGVLAIQIKVID